MPHLFTVRRAAVLFGMSAVFAFPHAGAQRAPRPSSTGSAWAALSAISLVDTALSRMGGAEALAGITSMRADMMTQWQRTTFDVRPGADVPSYERHVEVRDYTSRRWRNTRTFLPSPVTIVDIVDDTVGARTAPAQNGAQNGAPNSATSVTPLNVAYIDERRQLFAFAPERTLLLARQAPDLRRGADTVIDGVVHARVAGTAEGFPATWFLRRTDGLPAMVRYRSDDTNDFGLAPLGLHDVDIWTARGRG